MINRSMGSNLIGQYFRINNTSIEEGYANSIAYDTDLGINYILSDLAGGSFKYWAENILHEDGKYYNHSYEIRNWKASYYVGDYSMENMFIVKELVSGDDILKLLTSFNGKKRLREATNKFFLDVFKNSGYYKIEGDPNVLEGKWLFFRCDYEENSCEFDDLDVNLW